MDSVIGSYEEYLFFKFILDAIDSKEIADEVKKAQILSLLPLFHRDGKKLLYQVNLCVTRKSVANVLQMAHDSKIAGHCGFAKMMSRLEKYHWKNKERDVKSYVQDCMACQQKKDHGSKRFTDPMSLEVPKRRWG